MHYLDSWYVYYDSLFIQTIPLDPASFLSNFSADKISWSSISDSKQISEIFQTLETFIKTSENWRSSNCTNYQLGNIETELNLLLFYLQVEKKYACEFWKSNKRRILSSTVRIDIFVQMLVKSLIPYPEWTILSCKNKQKLCVNFKTLKTLMNDLKKKTQRLKKKFVDDPYFSRQKDLISNYFDTLNCFFHKMPEIRKELICFHHKLLSYIDYDNRIQIAQQKPRLTGKRKDYQKKKQTENSPLSDDQENIKKQNFGQNIFEGNFYQIKKKISLSTIADKGQLPEKCISFPRHFKFQIDIENTEIRSPGQTLDSELFQRKDSDLKKSNSVFEPNRNPSLYESFKRNETISGRRKQSTYFRGQAKTQQMVLLEKNDIIIMPRNEEKEEDRGMTGINPHYEERKKLIVKSNRIELAENLFESERKTSQTFSLQSGKKISRGWQFIRNFVWDRINQRKLTKKLQGINALLL